MLARATEYMNMCLDLHVQNQLKFSENLIGTCMVPFVCSRAPGPLVGHICAYDSRPPEVYEIRNMIYKSAFVGEPKAVYCQGLVAMLDTHAVKCSYVG